MHPRWFPGLKRLIALLVLLSGATPSAFELIGHGDDGGPQSLHHIESATFRHHADQCLGAAAVSTGADPVVDVPCLTVRAGVTLAPVEGRSGLLASSRRDRPTSRGPPLLPV